MHDEQMNFCRRTKKLHPDHFQNKKVLDIGSLDVNGTNHRFFSNCTYTGLDVAEGNNVDIVMPGHEYAAPDGSYDTIISTECFEHDMHYKKTMTNIVRLLKPGGMFIFTCAGPGREEHGTQRTRSEDSPLTSVISGEWSNWYHNISEKELRTIIDMEETFEDYYIDEHHEILSGPFRNTNDLYFWGIKK